MIQKHKRVDDPAWLAQIRQQPCAACGKQGQTEAAHIRIGSLAGMGQKPGDDSAVPLCNRCHQYQHSIGEAAFWLRAFADNRLVGQVLQAWRRNEYAKGGR